MKVFIVKFSEGSSTPEFVVVVCKDADEAKLLGLCLVQDTDIQVVDVIEVDTDRPHIAAVATYCC